MHIKRLLSGTLAALMVVTSFNMPTSRVYAAEETKEVVEATGDVDESSEDVVDDTEDVVGETATTDDADAEAAAPAETPGEELEEDEAVEKPLLNEADKKLTVSFNLDGGKIGEETTQADIASSSVEAGVEASITLPANPTKEGYTFDGWKVGDTTEVLPTTATTYSKTIDDNVSVTLKATWIEWSRTVKYDLNGGTGTIADQTLNYTATALPTVATPTYTGKKFQCWSLTTGNNAVAVTLNDIKVTAAGMDAITLHAIWADKYDLSNSTVTVNDFTYTGSEQDLASTDVTVADASSPIASSNYDVVFKKGTETITKFTDAGTYSVTVTAKANNEDYTGSKTVEFTVAKKIVNANIAANAADTHASGRSATSGVFALYYNSKATTAGARGTVAEPVEPEVKLYDTATTPALIASTELSPYGDDADWSVEYSNNTAEGKGKATVVLSADAYKNYAFVRGVGGQYKEFQSMEVLFDIEDNNSVTNIAAGKTKIDKATISDTGATAGKKYGYDQTYFGYVEEEIPAVVFSDIVVEGDRAKDKLSTITLGKIRDTKGTVVFGNANAGDDKLEIKSRTTEDGATGIITLGVKGTATTEYDGTCKVTYTFADKCEGEHKWFKNIRPADFGAAYDGSYRWECELDGTEATDLDAIKEIDPTAKALKGTIAHLDDEHYSFTLSNGKDAENVVDSEGAEIGYRGTAITASDLTFKTTDDVPITITKNQFGDKEYEDDIFTVGYSGNAAVGTATMTVTFTDVIPEYEGAKFTYKFKVKEASESVEAADWSVSKPAYKKGSWIDKYSYGTKLSFVTATTDAKIYYHVCSTSNETLTLTDIDYVKNAIASKALVLYQDPIELVSAMAVTDIDGDADTAEQIRIIAVTVKGNAYDASTVAVLGMVPEEYDWGDVTSSDTSKASAAELPKGLWISDDSMGYLDGQTYNGYAKTFLTKYGLSSYEPKVFFHNQQLKTSDFTYKFTNNVNAWTEAGASAGLYPAAKIPTVTVTGKGDFAGGYTATFEIEPQDISNVSRDGEGNITSITEYSRYPVTPYDGDATLVLPENGKVQTPKFTVKALDSIATAKAKKDVYKTLSQNKDFTVDYSQVKETPGDYTVTITGIGNYASLVQRTVTISPVGLYLNKANVTIDTKSVVFDGTDQTKNVKVSVKIGDVELIEGTDCDVKYNMALPYYLTNTSIAAYASSYDKVYSAGKYMVKIVPHDDVDDSKDSPFLGEYTKAVNISNNTATAISKATITGVGKTAEFDKPGFDDIEVTLAGNRLVEGKDYFVGYSFDIDNNYRGPSASVGNAKVTIYGIGKYSGSKAVSYKITGVDVKNLIVAYDEEVTYNGKTYLPDGYAGTYTNALPITVKYQPDTNVKLDTITSLIANTDYEVTYNKKADFTNVGKKTFTIVGKGKYTGKKTFTYKVNPFDMDAEQAKITLNSDGFVTANTGTELLFDYQEALTTPSYKVLDFTGAGVQPSISGTIYNSAIYGMTDAQIANWIKQNFTFKYSNDYKKVGGTVTVTVTPKKNFKGNAIKMYYNVDKGDISTASISVADKVEGTWTAPKPTVTLGGKKLTEGAKKDYTVTAYFAKATKLTNGTGKKATEVTRAKYSEPQKGDIIPAGTEIIVKVTGVNNYDNFKEVSYRYVAKTNDISKASVKISGQYVYNGSEIKLNKDDISVILNKKALASTDFEIVEYTYPKTGAGTAKVRLHGVGDFGGYKDATFKIDKASMNYMVEFKYDNKDPKDAKKILTVTGSTKTLSSAKNSFVLPKSGFTAKYVAVDAKTKKTTTTNYILTGWYDADNDVTYGVGEAFASEKDAGVVKTLIAKFEEAPAKTDTYTIEFDKGTGTGDAPKSITALRGTTYKLPAKGKLAKDGYEFTGWKLSTAAPADPTLKAGTTVYNLAAKGGKVKFIAQYDNALYKINYNAAGGKIISTKGTYAYNDTAATALLVPEKPGYEFTGWKASKDVTYKYASNKVELPAKTKGNLSLTAQYSPIKYTIEYDVQGHAASVSDSTTYTVGATKAAEVPVLKTVTINTADASEFTFLGWAKNKDSVKPDYVAGKPAKNLIPDSATKKVKLYGVYAEKKYGITYDLDGGKALVTLPRSYTKAGMSNVSALLPTAENMFKAGHDFAGWVGADGNAVTWTTAEPKTLKAKWTANSSKYSVSFDFGLATKASDFNETEWKKDVTQQPIDTEVTLPTFDADKVKLANHTFQGWATTSTLAAAGKVAYPDGGKFTIPREDVTLYAVYAPDKWTISYNLDGGQFVEGNDMPSSYVAGQTITVSNPTKKGHTFNTWEYEYYKTGTTGEKEKKTIKPISDLSIIEPVTFTATWTANKVGIGYHFTEGGDWATLTPAYSAPDEYTYGKESEVTLPDKDKVVNVGYTFAGWYKTGDSKKTVITSIPTGNETALSLEAKWTINTYNLTYSGMETTDKFATGTAADYKLPTSWKATDTAIATLANLADREDKTFDGWTIGEKSNTNTPSKSLTLTAAALDKGTTVYANWTDKDSVKLVYSDGGTGADEKTVEVEKAYAGTKLAANTFTKGGHTFAGWTIGAADKKVGYALTDGDISGASGTPKTIKVVAKWNKWTNTVKFELNGHGSSAPADKTFDYLAEVKDSDKVALPLVDDVTNFEFKGWSTNPSATTPDTGLAKSTTATATTYYLNPTRNHQTTILYGVWAEAKHATVKFDSDGGTTVNDIVLYAAGDATLPAGPTKAGYTFTGWLEQKSGATKVDAASTRTVTSEEVNANKTITFKAQWEAADQNVTLVLDGGTLAEAATTGTGAWTVNTGKATNIYKATAALTLPAITKTGYAFDGWYSVTADDAEIDDESVLATEVPAGATGEKFFKAQWTVYTNTISFDLNGGSMKKGYPALTAEVVKYGTTTGNTAPAATNINAPKGYEFDKWNTKADGTGTDYAAVAELAAAFQPGTASTDKAAQATTLYAKYKAIEYTITYTMNDGTNAAGNPAKYTIATDTITLADATKEGFTFDGWTTDGVTTPTKGLTIPKGSTGNKTFVANFTAN